MTRAEIKKMDKIEFGKHLVRRFLELREEYRIRELREQTGFKMPRRVKIKVVNNEN
jgi:hypothetical protein